MSVAQAFLFDSWRGGLNPERFDAEWRRRSRIARCPVSAVDVFMRAHYLRRRPGVVTLCLVMLVDLEPVGTCVFSAAPVETEKRYCGPTWELARLYIIDEVPRNAETWLIGQSIRYVKRHCSEVVCLVSYADPAAGHRGTIYYASNWTPDGRTDEERRSPRVDYVDARTGKKYGRRSHIPVGRAVDKVPRVSKYRFVYRLNNAVSS